MAGFAVYTVGACVAYQYSISVACLLGRLAIERNFCSFPFGESSDERLFNLFPSGNAGFSTFDTLDNLCSNGMKSEPLFTSRRTRKSIQYPVDLRSATRMAWKMRLAVRSSPTVHNREYVQTRHKPQQLHTPLDHHDASGVFGRRSTLAHPQPLTPLLNQTTSPTRTASAS